MEKTVETPTMKRKAGKIMSVGVAPCQAAWRSGGKTAEYVPGSVTRIIAAIVIPRMTSSDSRRGAETAGARRRL